MYLRVDTSVSKKLSASIFRAEVVAVLFRNVGTYLQVHTALLPRRLPLTTVQILVNLLHVLCSPVIVKLSNVQCTQELEFGHGTLLIT
jgi:hypothetical protein